MRESFWKVSTISMYFSAFPLQNLSSIERVIAKTVEGAEVFSSYISIQEKDTYLLCEANNYI